MKLLVMSDIHGDKKRFLDILKTHEDADYTISLGDSELKRKLLMRHDVIAIKGNYPLDAGIAHEHTMEILGRKVLLTHGHRLKVKTGYERLHLRMLEIPVDIALHGHTHRRVCRRIGEKYVLNPGIVKAPAKEDEESSYMVMRFRKDDIDVVWHDATLHHEIGQTTLDI